MASQIIFWISFFLICLLLYIYRVYNEKPHSHLWILADFFGLRAIWFKISPPYENDTKLKKPSTFIFWIIGIYVAFIGVASQRYENRIDIIENRANTIFAQAIGIARAMPVVNKLPGFAIKTF